MYKVLVVEDNKMARDNIASYISESTNYELAGAIVNASYAELFCTGRHVDLILMDVCTEHDESGIDATAIIKKRFLNIKVIIITSMAECSFLDRARAVGADSFWYKHKSCEELLSVMDRTMSGESIFPERTPEVRLGLTTSYSITRAEMAALRAVMESSDYNEAASKLGCSERTIRFHISNILDKTGYRSRFELCMVVAQKSLIITTPDKNVE